MGRRYHGQESLFFSSRLISPEALKNERIYASIVGQMCEPPIMSLLNPSSPEHTVEIGFVRNYKSLQETAGVILSSNKSISSSHAHQQYVHAGLLDYQETRAELSRRGVQYLPKNQDLAQILLLIDDYVKLEHGNSFLGAYQAICEKSVNGNLHAHARFLINGVLVVAREIIARSANAGEVQSELGRWNKVEKTVLGTSTNKLWENVKLWKDQNKGSLQFDGVLLDTTSPSFSVFGLPLRDWERGEITPWILFEMKGLPWSLINLKLINSAGLTTGRSEIQSVRAVDIKQLYDQLTSATDCMLSLSREPITYPRSAIFVYARPFKKPRVFERKLDVNFFLDYLDYLDDVKVVGRLMPEQLEPIEIVSHSLVEHLETFKELSDVLDIRRRRAGKMEPQIINRMFPVPRLSMPMYSDESHPDVTAEAWHALWDQAIKPDT